MIVPVESISILNLTCLWKCNLFVFDKKRAIIIIGIGDSDGVVK